MRYSIRGVLDQQEIDRLASWCANGKTISRFLRMPGACQMISRPNNRAVILRQTSLAPFERWSVIRGKMIGQDKDVMQAMTAPMTCSSKLDRSIDRLIVPARPQGTGRDAWNDLPACMTIKWITRSRSAVAVLSDKTNWKDQPLWQVFVNGRPAPRLVTEEEVMQTCASMIVTYSKTL